VPGVLGVPVIAPVVGSRVRPEGREVDVHAKGPMPPEGAGGVYERGDPLVPEVLALVGEICGLASTTIVTLWSEVLLSASETVRVTL